MMDHEHKVYNFLLIKLRLLAPVMALTLMLNHVLIKYLLYFNDPSWWSDGPPENLNVGLNVLRFSAESLMIYFSFIISYRCIGLNLPYRTVISLSMIPGVAVTSFHIMPFYFTAFEGVLFLLPVSYFVVVFGWFVQFSQFHLLFWGENIPRSSDYSNLLFVLATLISLSFIVFVYIFLL